ncbi:MAG: rhomboid family intramembrane serine protease [Deltaproteobacteria bacterium]|nr:rhomboid family intramembrane serine protease [Deltaproteobacteria bacterium]
MQEEPTITLQVPRFTPWMRRLSQALAGLWLVSALWVYTGRSASQDALGSLVALALIPHRAVQGLELWRFVTHPFLHDPSALLPLLGSVLSLWLFGSPLERRWGPRPVLTVLAAGTVSGALLLVGASFLELRLLFERAYGMVGGGYALAVCWGLAHRDEQSSLFGLATLTGRQIAWLTLALALLWLLVDRSGNNVAGLGGALGGALYARWRARPRRPEAKTREGSGRFQVIEGGLSDKKWMN